ncbi:E3 ubiquitin-protein ligase RFWD3 [Holothuria leucospilota]|uniref:RING-type E3 ubiquitin transferase n=1 Tax=Holothuria leucospilota TaxID=206669 RepID=A0A9Q0YFU8_HOLLE|nr:E3 ubiquitin-protein ligase RFWD3 [Holothuria leucospilota]
MDYDAETDVESDNDEASERGDGSNTPGGEGRSRTSSVSDLFDGDDSDEMEVDENSNESSDATEILSGRSNANDRQIFEQTGSGIESNGQGADLRTNANTRALGLGGPVNSGHGITDRTIAGNRNADRNSQLSDSENSERLFRNIPNMVQVSNEQLAALPVPASTGSSQPQPSFPSLPGNYPSSTNISSNNATVTVTHFSSQPYQPAVSFQPHNLNRTEPGSSTNQAQNSESAAVPDGSSSVDGREERVPSNFVNIANILNSVPRDDDGRTRDERRDSLADFKLPEKKQENEASEDSDSDDESQTCSICYEAWSNSGSHRLASLKCGHVFGQSCIIKWLKGKDGKCPHCCAKAKKSDIRVIFARKLKAIDTSERDKALKDLQQEKELRRKVEIEKAQIHLKYQMALEEVNRMKAQIRLQSATSSSSMPSGSASSNDTPAPTLPGSYVLEKTITASANGNSRVLVYDYSNSALVASVPSSNQILFQGFGVKKIGVLNWHNQYLPIHSKPIRGMSFNGRNDGLLLTGSMDKTLKITSLASNTVVQSYDAPAPVWSCCWNDEDVNYLFAGLSNGTIVVYDTRNTSEEVLTLNREGSKHPIVAMNYVHKALGSNFPCSGLLVGTLSNCSFWELKTPVDFTPHILPLEGNCVSLSFEPTTRHCLASFRPSKVQPSMRHVMCELLSTPVSGETEPIIKCNPIHSFFGGATVKLLARSAIFRRPSSNDHLLVAAGDEGSNSLDLWDGNSGAKVQRLSTGATILDVCPFRFNNCDYLAALSEKVIKLYQWKT